MTASFQAIQDNNAHLTRAGYFATPLNAIASPRTSSSGSGAAASVADCMSATKASCVGIASATVCPSRSSYMTLALACEIEQPWLS